jgi:hypothetical protein
MGEKELGAKKILIFNDNMIFSGVSFLNDVLENIKIHCYVKIKLIMDEI